MQSQLVLDRLAQGWAWLRRVFFALDADVVRRCTLMALAILLQAALDLPRDQLSVIFGPRIGLLPMAVLLGSIALTFAALTSPPISSGGPRKEQIPRAHKTHPSGQRIAPQRTLSPRWTVAALALCLVAGIIGIRQVGLMVYESFTPTVYTNDGTTLDQYAALELLRGHDPYQSVNIAAAVRELHQPFSFATPLRRGIWAQRSWLAYPTYPEIHAVQTKASPQQPPPELESRVSYPALSFLLLVPFVAVGLPSVVLFAVIALALFVWLALRAVAPPLRPWLALLILVDVPILNGVLVGDLDVATMLLLFGAWLLWRDARWSAILFGLALATKQQAWFFIPFYAIFIGFGGLAISAARPFGSWATWRDAILRLAGAAGIFLAINLPFILHDGHAWLMGVLAPVRDPMFPRGPGLVQFALARVLPLWPQPVYTALELLGILAAVGWYAWRGARRYPATAFILALLPLWLAWRSLPTYFYFAALPALALWLAWHESAPQTNGGGSGSGGRLKPRLDGVPPQNLSAQVKLRPTGASEPRPRRWISWPAGPTDVVSTAHTPRDVLSTARVITNGAHDVLKRIRERLPQLLAFATPSAVWALWGISRAQMLLNLILGHHYCDPQFYQYAGDFAVGRWPYQSVQVEYPPLALVAMILPALPLLPFAGIAPRPDANPHPLHPDPVRYAAYGISFGLVMLAVDALTLWLVMRAGRRSVAGDARGVWSGLLYVLVVFASGALLQKFDLIMGLLCLVAVLALLAERDGWAWAALVGATMLKGFPILLVPLFILWRVRGGRVEWRTLRRGIIGGATASLAVLLPALWLGGIAPLIHSVTYHTSRGIEIESVPASIMLALGWLPGWGVYSSFDLADLSRDVHSALSDPLNSLMLVLLISLVLALYARFWYNMRGASSQMMLGAATLALLIFMVTFRAFPLHYLLGIAPLIALVRLPAPWQTRWLWAILLACVAGQMAITFWHNVVALQPFFAGLLVGRNALIIAAGVFLARGALWGRSKEMTEGTPPLQIRWGGGRGGTGCTAGSDSEERSSRKSRPSGMGPS